jgi:hypothetical protein
MNYKLEGSSMRSNDLGLAFDTVIITRSYCRQRNSKNEYSMDTMKITNCTRYAYCIQIFRGHPSVAAQRTLDY